MTTADIARAYTKVLEEMCVFVPGSSDNNPNPRRMPGEIHRQSSHVFKPGDVIRINASGLVPVAGQFTDPVNECRYCTSLHEGLKCPNCGASSTRN